MWCWHKWSKRTPVKHYIDTSYGQEAESTGLVRSCSRCGKWDTDSVYARALPLEDWPC